MHSSLLYKYVQSIENDNNNNNILFNCALSQMLLF